MDIIPQKLKLFLISLLNVTICNFCISQNGAQLKVEIEKLIRFDTEIDFEKTPGFIIGVLDGDSTFIFDFGTKDKTSPQVKLSSKDIFEIGSITKLYMTQLINALEYQKILDVNDKVNQWLETDYSNPRLEHLTIQHLITHTSGLPKRPTWFGKKEKNSQNPYEYYKTADLLKFYRDFIPDKKTKSFIYSHTNFALLELIIQRATQMSIEDALQYYLAQPLKMSSTFIDFTENKSEAATIGYDRMRKPTMPWTFASFKASEGIKTNLDDALLFMKYSLVKKIKKDEISSSTFSESLKMWNGWHLIAADRINVLTHTGQTSGHNAFMAISPDANTGVVIFANSSIGTEDLGMQILRMINNNWRRRTSNL